MAWKAFSRNVKELRILLCQTSPASAPTRSFIEKNYKELKTVNPKLPFLIRDCSGTEPQMWARYDLGVEKGIRLEGLTEQQISQVLEQLAKVGTSTKAIHELDSAEDLSVQRHFWALHVGSMGALSIQLMLSGSHESLYNNFFIIWWLFMFGIYLWSVDSLVLVLMWFVFYNGSRYATEFYTR